MNQVAIVTGGSGGIGRCTAQELRRAGCTVYEFSRREKPAEGVIHLTAVPNFSIAIGSTRELAPSDNVYDALVILMSHLNFTNIVINSSLNFHV